MTRDRIEKIHKVFLRNQPVVKTAMLRSEKICSRDINELLTLGYIVKIKSGHYAWADKINEFSAAELSCALIPSAVISTLSSAIIHDLIAGDINKLPLYLTIPNNMVKPVLPDEPPIVLLHCSPEIFSLGILQINNNNKPLKIYDEERTICDLFKYSSTDNTIAIQAAKTYFSKDTRDIEKLQEYSALLRVQKYISPLAAVLK